jgi:hypothetical protein
LELLPNVVSTPLGGQLEMLSKHYY